MMTMVIIQIDPLNTIDLWKNKEDDKMITIIIQAQKRFRDFLFKSKKSNTECPVSQEGQYQTEAISVGSEKGKVITNCLKKAK